MWPTPLYNIKTRDRKNPLRCLLQHKDQRRAYFEHMSEAFATMCDVFATVMVEDVDRILQNGIWGRIEFPTLQKSGNDGTVYSIVATTPDGGKVKDIWSRFSGPKTKRQGGYTERSGPSCGTDDATAAVFDEGGELPVDW